MFESEDPELQKLYKDVLQDDEDFEKWEKLVRAAESQEGGLNRNSSPGAIASFRDTYDRFLARFPLFFGYWKKYADLEFTIAGTEAAEMVYERGVASIGTSVDLWANYCGFKIDTSHDPDVIRDTMAYELEPGCIMLFERGADSVGLDFLAHPFWDKYIEYEERMEAQDHIFAILGRVIHIPLHQYARYFEKYRNMAKNRPITELAPPQMMNQFRDAVIREGGPKQKSEPEIEQDLRKKIDAYHLDIFNQTQGETTKRWTYESEVKRPYYHVTDLDEAQQANWHKYLDFEQNEGNYLRIKFLYERCVVTAANYEEFWLRYARWMTAQEGKEEEVRSIYQRASCVYAPISKPQIRLFYAQFEESQGRADISIAIYEAILMNLPDHIETIVALANAQRRQSGLSSAIALVKKHLESPDIAMLTRGTLIPEMARLKYKESGNADAARKVYEHYEAHFTECAPFWTSWLRFELQQSSAEADEQASYARVKAVFDSARHAPLDAGIVQSLSSRYFEYLKECGGKDAMAEYMALDQQINGPGDPSTRVARGGASDPMENDTAATNKLSAQRGGMNGMQR